MNILVTSLSRKVPLLEAVRAAMGKRRLDGVLWGGDTDPECVGRHFSDRFWEMPRLSSPDARPAVLEFCERESIELLIPTRDGELAFFASLREELATRGTLVAVGTSATVAICLDKVRFHDHCVSLGIPTAATSTALANLDGDQFVVKNRLGSGAREMAVGLGRDEAIEYATRLPEPIFQPMLGGLEHSVDLYVNRAGAVVDAAPRTRIRVHEGESTVTETVEHPVLWGLSVQLAEALELRGHAVIQAFATPSDVTLLECNPRVGGASTLGFHAGVDTPGWLIDEAQAQPVEPVLGGYRRDLRLIRYPADRLVEP